MPAVSQAQRGSLNAHFGHAWVKRHGFDNKGTLPRHVPRDGRKFREKSKGMKLR